MSDGRVLGESGSVRNRKRFVLGEYKGYRYLEIQESYKDSDSGEWNKKKGVSLNAQSYGDFKATIASYDEMVMDWIGRSYVPSTVVTNVEVRSALASTARYETGGWTIVEYSNDRDVRFAHVQHLGGNDEIHFNTAHALWEFLQRCGPLALTFFCTVIQSFARARQGLEGAPADDSQGLLPQLETEWAQYLARSIAKLKE